MTTNIDTDATRWRGVWNPDDNSGAPPRDVEEFECDELAERIGGKASDAMAVITGKPVTVVGSGNYRVEQLQSALASGKIVTLASEEGIGDPGPHGLFEGHSYLVTGIVERDGKVCVTLHNPWNKSQPDPVPYDELESWFSSVAVGSVS